MESPQKIITRCKKMAVPFLKATSFSDQPGVYFVYFGGNRFPVQGFQSFFKKNDLIYIGKTESSQISRDVNTHFASGKTGSSTLRRSLGAILKGHLRLRAIARNEIDFSKGRSTYKFDTASEERLTKWMKDNLALSFLPYPKGKMQINELETLLINLSKPVLNLSKNPGNTLAQTIKLLRKRCVEEAKEDGPVPIAKQIPKKTNTALPISQKSGIHKYEEIWTRFIPHLLEFIKAKRSSVSVALSRSDFEAVGARASGYSFNLQLKNGLVQNNIGGSAVARDLVRVIGNDNRVTSMIRTCTLKIRMDKNFTVTINRL